MVRPFGLHVRTSEQDHVFNNFAEGFRTVHQNKGSVLCKDFGGGTRIWILKKRPELEINKMLQSASEMTWELTVLERQDWMDVSDCMSTSALAKSIHDFSFEVFEPARLCALAAPPKRFYRTFWRSITRRLLECKKKSQMM